ncbi:MAG: (d)CMP kinase [Coriobacteriaceae bacterium]|nr:(d)CMP kinase [Coriobacteriaceae bacterium]
MIVAIDGPAGSGKSTVAKAIAKRCGLTLLDTGAMYRSCALLAVQAGLDVYDPASVDAIVDIARAADIRFEQREEGQGVFANGQDVTAEIRTHEIDVAVSPVSAIAGVREAMVAQQRAIAQDADVVAEGRDIGTVVFPNADVKVFLTADPEARALRRAVQRAGGDSAKDKDATADQSAVEEILADLKRRDAYDSGREVAPLKPAEDAVHIDSSLLSVDEVVASILALNGDLKAMDSATAPADPEPAPEPEVEAPSAATEPEPAPSTAPTAEKKPSAKASKNAKAAEGPMRAFAGNSFDDYYDHAMSEYPLLTRAFYGIVIGVVGGVTKVFWPWKIEDLDKLLDKSHGRMIIMNHVGLLDPMLIIVSCAVRGIAVRPIFKSEFNVNKLTTWFFSRVGGIPVNRGTADMKALRRARAALERGENVLVFPEGTRIKSDDEEVTIHGGFALMAQLAKAPVLPTAIVGVRDLRPRGAKIPKFFKRVFAKVGDEITFESLGIKGKKQQVEAMERIAMEKVYELRDYLRAEHPGKM